MYLGRSSSAGLWRLETVHRCPASFWHSQAWVCGTSLALLAFQYWDITLTNSSISIFPSLFISASLQNSLNSSSESAWPNVVVTSFNSLTSINPLWFLSKILKASFNVCNVKIYTLAGFPIGKKNLLLKNQAGPRTRVRRTMTRRTGGRVNLNFLAPPYGVAFLNPWNKPNKIWTLLNSKIKFEIHSIS